MSTDYRMLFQMSSEGFFIFRGCMEISLVKISNLSNYYHECIPVYVVNVSDGFNCMNCAFSSSLSTDEKTEG